MSGRTDPLCVDGAALLAEVQPIRDACALDRPDIMAGLTVYRRKRASVDNGRGPYVLTPLAA